MAVVIRARKFLTNKLLSRKQMVLYLNQILDVIHPDLANVSKDKLKDIISKKYKVDARSNRFIKRYCFVWL
jgi:small subunit ribosomal protein S24e